MPERIGDFVLDRPLASGGMGEVWLAHHRELGTPVAIKLMPPPVGEDASAMRERFAREARLQAAVDHPGVVRVLDCDVVGDRPYLVLEFVAGRSLRELLQEGPLPVEEAVRLGAEVADVLAAAHGRGVLHRDIKPENVMRAEDGRVRVLDFGIARARDGDAPVTRTGEIVGTPQYMAPEQILDAGDEVDERADVHALGVLVYELLTGSNPFHGTNVFAALKLVESLVPRPPSALRDEVPAAVDRVVLEALAKDRARRWPSAAAFGAALRGAIGEAAGRPRRRWPVGLGALLAIGIGVALGSSLDGGGGEAEPIVAGSDASAPSLLETGTERLSNAEFHAAVADFELSGAPAARPLAQLAWLCAYRALPLSVDAPAHWTACDELRRARLFAADREVDETVADLLSRGEAALAWRRVQPAIARPPGVRSGRDATLALLAAHMACHDRRVLRAVAARLPDAHPEVAALLALRLLPRAERAAPLRELARRLPPEGPDRWLVQLLAASLEPEWPGDRARGQAEVAWLHGAGEAAVVWFVGARLAAAAPPDNEEAARLGALLAGSDPKDAPVVPALRQMLGSGRTYAFDSPAAVEARLVAEGVDLGSFEAMARLLKVGAEPDGSREPWSRLSRPPLHERWLEEVCGGVQ